MRKIILIPIILIIFHFVVIAQEDKEISPEKAHKMLEDSSAYLVDVRSIAEYVFVGHPERAYNIPLTFWNEEEQRLVLNEEFNQDIKSRFKEDDVLIFICRSGRRSLQAAKMAKQVGFIKIYHINEGFEGGRDERGYRTLDGWKNRGLPYTYDLKREFIYKFPTQKSDKTE